MENGQRMDEDDRGIIDALFGMESRGAEDPYLDDFLDGLGVSHSTPKDADNQGNADTSLDEVLRELRGPKDAQKDADVEDDVRSFSTISAATIETDAPARGGIRTNTSDQAGGGRRATSLTSWRSHTTGLLYLMVERMIEVGTATLCHRDLYHLHQSVPPLGFEGEVIPLMMLTIHTMKQMPNVGDVMKTWNQRLGVVTATSHQRTTRASGAPPRNGQPQAWDYDHWCLAVQVILRFLQQRLPAAEGEFLETIGDVMREAAMNSWAVEVIVLTAYFLWRTNWAWDVIFRK